MRMVKSYLEGGIKKQIIPLVSIKEYYCISYKKILEYFWVENSEISTWWVVLKKVITNLIRKYFTGLRVEKEILVLGIEDDYSISYKKILRLLLIQNVQSSYFAYKS